MLYVKPKLIIYNNKSNNIWQNQCNDFNFRSAVRAGVMLGFNNKLDHWIVYPFPCCYNSASCLSSLLLSFPCLALFITSKLWISLCFWGKLDVFFDGSSWLIQTFGCIQWWWMVAYHIQFANHWWHIIIIIIVIGSATCWSTIELVVLFNKKILYSNGYKKKIELIVCLYYYDL